MKAKTLFLTLVLLTAARFASAQLSHASESMNTRDVRTNAKLQLECDDCASINEVQIRGEGVQFNATYRGDAWREIFPKTLDLAAGDYTIRFKLNNLKWKTLHLYIRKDEKESLLLN